MERRSEKDKKLRALEKRQINIMRFNNPIYDELQKGDAEMRLLYKFLKERIQQHNSKLQSQTHRQN